MWYIRYTAWSDAECIDAAIGPFKTESHAEEYTETMYDYWGIVQMNKKELEHYMVDLP